MITISVITPTFRREDLLARCVESVLAQQVAGAQFEHIVVNDAREPLARAPWQDDPRVRVLDTNRTERSVARNTGAALSQGQWLYFLDDDDYALPGAFAAMLAVTEAHPDAVHVYGGYEIHNETTHQTEAIQPTLAGDLLTQFLTGELFPLQASWFRRDAFFAAGGFDPLLAVTEDVDLLRRVGFLGPTFGTTFVSAHIRVEHPQTTTSQWETRQECWAQGIDKCLQRSETLPRLRRATRQQPYWRGRCVREYVGSARHALRRGRFGQAGSRLAAGLNLGLPHLLRPVFWKGLRKEA